MSTRRVRRGTSRRLAALSGGERPRRSGFFGRIHIPDGFTWPRIGVLVGLVILALLPSAWGPRLVPYRLRQVLRRPIYARTDFTWANEEEADPLRRRLEATFAHYYNEDTEWVSNIFSGVYSLLYQADALAEQSDIELPAAAKQLAVFAKEQGVVVEPGECLALISGLRVREQRPSLYWDIIDPAQGEILKSKIYSVGVLSSADHQREINRTIRIVTTYDQRRDQRRSTPVGQADGPRSLSELPRGRDAYFDVEYGRFTRGFRRAFVDILSRRLSPSLLPDPARSRLELEGAIAQATQQANHVRHGETLMPAGRPVSAADLTRIQAEAEAYEASQGRAASLVRLGGMAALLLIAGIGFMLYLTRFEAGVFDRARSLAMLLLLAVLVLWVVQIGLMAGLPLTPVPVGLVAGVAALVFGPRVGVGTVSLLTLTGFILTETDMGGVLSLLASGWVFCCLAPGVRHRGGLLRAGALAGALSFLVSSFWRFATGSLLAFSPSADGGWEFLVRFGAYDAAVWMAGGVLLTVALPLVERLFGAATNISLLELSDQEHPCLRQLVLKAPGTYHHSVVVANLAESAAEAVGANPLLVRVGAYYHDIGKIPKPEYFTENNPGRSPHDGLAPTISTLIITAHVKDGVEMARAYELPEMIIDLIEQHHGDSVVSFFYHRACEQAADADAVAEATFRYPGPRPRSREAALLLLADCVEAASRSLSEPKPAHLERLVKDIITDRLMAGQLDDSPLTFRDVAQIESSFIRTLNAMYHSRVKYPDGKGPGRRRR